jgi:tetratricopeptide (TPR) repeat protein/NAD-dependent SIR2 family protein deacetylase
MGPGGMAEREARLGSVADIANAIRMAAADDDKSLGRAVFFIGAGCSVSAGIPLASGMARELVQRLATKAKAPETIRKKPDAAYRWLASKQQMRDCCTGPVVEGGEDKRPIDWHRVYDTVFSDHFNTPDDAREVFSGFVDAANGQVNWAHLCLGELVKQKLVSTVITTNFDQLVLAGLVRSGVLPVVCDGTESLTRIRGAPLHPQIIELHGSRHTYRLRNSPEEVAELANDEQTIASIGSIFQDMRAFVLVGYGGREDGIMDLLIKAAQRFPDKRLIWVAHNEDPGQLTDKAKRFLATSRNAILLVGQDGDSFFLRLLMALEIGAPETIREPLFLAARHAGLLALQGAEGIADGATIRDALDRHRAEITMMRAALATHRDNLTRIEQVLSEARNLRLAGKLSDAFQLLDSIKHTEDPRVWVELADVAHEFGPASLERKPLDVAAEAAQHVLAHRDRKTDPTAWAEAQDALGKAFFKLGKRDNSTARLKRAVAAFRDALQERTRARAPLDWASTQNSLGDALAALSPHRRGTAPLKEAVAAHQNALQEFTRERGPLQWAASQNKLGNALLYLGQRETGTVRLEEAVAAYRDALRERTRERVPLEWAATQHNLGLALRELGQRESGTARLEETIAAHRQALLERTRERVPLEWATTQYSLAAALRSLGERESDVLRLKEAIDAYEAALKVFEEAGVSHYIKSIEQALALTRTLLGKLPAKKRKPTSRKKA